MILFPSSYYKQNYKEFCVCLPLSKFATGDQTSPPFLKISFTPLEISLRVSCTMFPLCFFVQTRVWNTGSKISKSKIFLFFSLPFYTMSLYQNDNNILFFPLRFSTFNWFFFSLSIYPISFCWDFHRSFRPPFFLITHSFYELIQKKIIRIYIYIFYFIIL